MKWINISPLIQKLMRNEEFDANMDFDDCKKPITSKNPMLSVPELSLFDTMNAVEIMDIRMDQCVELNGKNLKKSDLTDLDKIQMASGVKDNSIFATSKSKSNSDSNTYAYDKMKEREVIFNGDVANGIVLRNNLTKNCNGITITSNALCTSSTSTPTLPPTPIPYKTGNELDIKSTVRILHWYLINETANYRGDSIVETLYYNKYCWKATWDAYEQTQTLLSGSSSSGVNHDFYTQCQDINYVKANNHLSVLLNLIIIEYSKVLMIGMYAYIKYIIEADTFEDDDFNIHTTLVEIQDKHMESNFNWEHWIRSSSTDTGDSSAGMEKQEHYNIYEKLDSLVAALNLYKTSLSDPENVDVLCIVHILHACALRKLQTQLFCLLVQQQSVMSRYQVPYHHVSGSGVPSGGGGSRLVYDPTARTLELRSLLEDIRIELMGLLTGTGTGTAISELYTPMELSGLTHANSNHSLINGYLLDVDICYAFHTGLVRTLMSSPMRVISYATIKEADTNTVDTVNMLSSALGYIQKEMVVGLTQTGEGLALCDALAQGMERMTLEDLYEVLVTKTSYVTSHLVIRSYLYQNMKCMLVSPMQLRYECQSNPNPGSVNTIYYNVSSSLCLNSMCNNYNIPLAVLLGSSDVCRWLGLQVVTPVDMDGDTDTAVFNPVVNVFNKLNSNSIDKSIVKLVHYYCLSRCKLNTRLESQIFPLWGNSYAMQAHEFDQTNPWNQPTSLSMQLPTPAPMNFYTNWVAGINCMFMEAYVQQSMTTGCVQLNELDYMYWYLDYFVNIRVHILTTMKQYRSVFDSLLQRQFFANKNNANGNKIAASKLKTIANSNTNLESVSFSIDRVIERNSSVSVVSMNTKPKSSTTNSKPIPVVVPSYTAITLTPSPTTPDELYLKAKGQIYRSYIRLYVLCDKHNSKNFLKIRSPYTSFEYKYWNRFKAFAQCVSTAFLPYSDYVKSMIMYADLPSKQILDNIGTCYTNIKTLQEARKQLNQKMATSENKDKESTGTNSNIMNINLNSLGLVLKGIHDKNWMDIMKSLIINQIYLNKILKNKESETVVEITDGHFKIVNLNYEISRIYPIFELK